MRGAWREKTVGPRGRAWSLLLSGKVEWVKQRMVPKAHQDKYEEEHEQEQEHLKGPNNPRCLKWGESQLPYIRKDKENRY